MAATPSRHGKGRAIVLVSGREASFSELSYAYPLKLLSPGTISSSSAVPTAIAYILSYGGGLVSGDRIELGVDVRGGAALLLLTQGSTKVFRNRPRTEPVRASLPSLNVASDLTIQRLDAQISPGGFLLLLPDPVTCFKSATYSQSQTFKLKKGASIALLDWYTSGRMSRGEEWVFDSYRSSNEIWIEDKRVVKDVMLLESSNKDLINLPARSLKDRLRPYSCYATVFLFGPLVQKSISELRARYDSISQMQRSAPESFIWSLSDLENGSGVVVRAAGKETEEVKNWLRDNLRGLADVVGREAYSKAFV